MLSTTRSENHFTLNGNRKYKVNTFLHIGKQLLGSSYTEHLHICLNSFMFPRFIQLPKPVFQYDKECATMMQNGVVYTGSQETRHYKYTTWLQCIYLCILSLIHMIANLKKNTNFITAAGLVVQANEKKKKINSYIYLFIWEVVAQHVYLVKHFANVLTNSNNV